MTSLHPSSCRICLGPSQKFISVFSRFHNRPVRQIIENLTQIKIKKNHKIPKYVCESCFTSLLNADSIIETCRRNDTFLNELASVAEDCEEIIEVEVIRENESSFIDDKEVLIVEEALETPQLIENTAKIQEIDSIPWDDFEKINKTAKAHQEVTKQFFCSFCGCEFSSRQKLNYHEKSRHSKPVAGSTLKPWTCDRCGDSFKNRSHIINHLNVVHLKIKRFQCNLCGFWMYSKTHFSNHIKTHSNVREFQCEKCQKSFARKETLATHLKTHDGTRDYVCKFCGKSYTAHTDLKRHIFKHTKIHPYICQICQAGYFLKRELIAHVGKSHSGIDTSSWLNGKTSWINIMN